MRIARSAIALAAPVLLMHLAACSNSKPNVQNTFTNGGDDASGDDSGGLTIPTGDDSSLPTFNLEAGGEASKPCVGLECQVHSCGSATKHTTISGTVYDPAGKNPLYNVAVYVPNAPVKPLPVGATCDTCDSLYTGSPIVSTLTDAAGKFTLTDVPDGSNIPLVIQIGKWRRQITIPSVTQCADTALPKANTRLPSNHTEGDIPNIAISTGGADTLECLLRRIGIAAGEYGPADSVPNSHIHIYHGDNAGGLAIVPDTSPASPASASALWNSKANLMKYDIVLLSCEGQETVGMNQGALQEYANAGGRVFASHYHYSWFNTGPFGADNLASWTTGTADIGDITASIVTKLSSGAPFPKGLALQQWLTNVGALSGGSLAITQARHNADVGASNVNSQPWITALSGAPGATEYFTFNTPVGAAADKQCGRVVYSDLHVGAASNDYGGGLDPTFTTPSGCNVADLSAQEKALEFMLFDLSSCIVPDSTPPVPPKTPK